MQPVFRKVFYLLLTIWIYIVLWTSYHILSVNIKGISGKQRHAIGNKNLQELFRNNSFYKRKPIKETPAKFSKANNLEAGLLCQTHSDWNSRYFSKKVTTNFSLWTFEETQNCSDILLLEEIHKIKPQFRFSITCKGNHVKIQQKNTFENGNITNDDVPCFTFGDKCLGAYINECCRDRLSIPNILHYVRYKKDALTFFEFVSFISAIRFIRPCAILIHGDELPSGIYWSGILTLSPNIIHVKREPPDKIFGKRTIYREHAGDLMRIEALLMYGGIYLDTDTIIVKSLEPLRKYPCTMSKQSSGYISSAFIMAGKNATFLQKWLDGYRNHYKVRSYVYNAMEYPKLIIEKFENLIHIEYGKLSRPWSQIGFKIYNTNYKWVNIYGIHLFSRSYKNPMTTELIKYFNSTVGSICRHVLFGNKELCFKQ